MLLGALDCISSCHQLGDPAPGSLCVMVSVALGSPMALGGIRAPPGSAALVVSGSCRAAAHGALSHGLTGCPYSPTEASCAPLAPQGLSLCYHAVLQL